MRGRICPALPVGVGDLDMSLNCHGWVLAGACSILRHASTRRMRVKPGLGVLTSPGWFPLITHSLVPKEPGCGPGMSLNSPIMCLVCTEIHSAPAVMGNDLVVISNYPTWRVVKKLGSQQA